MDFIVTNSIELKNAIENASAGDTVLLAASAEPYDIRIQEDLGLTSELTFKSLDPEQPATVSTLFLQNTSNLVFDGLVFDSSTVADTRADWLDDIFVVGSSNVTIRNSEMIGNADSSSDDHVLMGTVRESEGFVFENNKVSGYDTGLFVRNTTDVEIVGNEFSDLQRDGLSLSGVQNVLIEDNNIYDVRSKTGEFTNTNLIHFFSNANTTLETSSVNITGNTLDAGEGSGTNAINVTNHLAAETTEGTDLFYSNISVSENTIHSSDSTGIEVEKTVGVDIFDNTLISGDQDATNDTPEGDAAGPGIWVDTESADVNITGNIAGTISAGEDAVIDSNQVADFQYSAPDSYENEEFDSAENWASSGLDDLTLDPDGPLGGTEIGDLLSPDQANDIVVNNSAELLEALKNATGGETISLANNGTPYSLTLDEDLGFSADVTIASLDQDNPAVVSTLYLRNTANLTFDGLDFDSASVSETRSEWLHDVTVFNSENITIRNSFMSGTADGPLVLGGEQDEAESAAYIRETDGFVFENNVVTGYNFGLLVLDSKNVDLTGNDITKLQGDPIRMGGVQNVDIEGNYIHDLYGSDGEINHMDMIQLWSTNTNIVTSNVNISGNVLDSGAGAGTQSIFMRNEAADKAEDGQQDLFYSNISITDNVIYNSHRNGIYVGQTDGLTISNNTLITNSKSGLLEKGELIVSNPSVWVNEASTDVTVVKNVAHSVAGPDGAAIDGNFLVNYDNVNAENYVGRVFVAAAFGGDVGLAGLSYVPDGPLGGLEIGSSLSQFQTNPESLSPLFTVSAVNGSETELLFDAGLTADSKGLLADSDAVFEWQFQDGTVLVGQKVVHDFGAGGDYDVSLRVTSGSESTTQVYNASIAVADPVLLDIDFSDAVAQDHSAYGSELLVNGGVSEEGVSVSHGTNFEVSRTNAHLYSLEQFSLTFGMKGQTELSDHGLVAGIHDSFKLEMTRDHELKFSIENAEGDQFEIVTRGAGLDDTDWHRVTVSFDGLGGKAAIFVDGEELGSAAVSGSSQAKEYWGLAFGNKHGAGYTGTVDEILFTADPTSEAQAKADSQDFHMQKSSGLYQLDSADTDFADLFSTDIFDEEIDTVVVASNDNALEIATSDDPIDDFQDSMETTFLEDSLFG